MLAATVPDAGAFERLVAGHAPEIDWAWLIERASVHKVAALLAARLARLGVERDFPDPVRRQLDTIRRRAAERAGHAARTLREVASALEARDIPVFVIKGSVLAEHVYGDPDVRPFDDVDLVIPKRLMGPAEDALLSLGYAFYPVRVKSFQFVPPGARPRGHPDSWVAEPLARDLYRAHHFHFAFAPPRGDPRLPVELHWHVALPRLLRFEDRLLWARTTTTVVAGRPVRTLDPAATIVYVALHAVASGPASFRLLHLADLVWLLTGSPSRYRWDDIRDVAESWGAQHYLTAALLAADRLMAAAGDGLLPAAPPPRARFASVTTPWSRACFRLAATETWLVERPQARGTVRGLVGELWQEALWDLGLGRRPQRALWRLAGIGRRLCGFARTAPANPRAA